MPRVKDNLHALARWFAPVITFSDSLVGSVSEQFHKVYYETVPQVTWQGVPVRKSVFDMWNYVEVIQSTKPDLIIECGTSRGGSGLFFVELGGCRVLSIDKEVLPNRPYHINLSYLEGDSTSNEVVDKVFKFAQHYKRIMVVLDSDHSQSHVAKELDIYSSLVSKNQYLVVEDVDVYGHPVFPDHGPGPAEALKDFLEVDKRFSLDSGRAKKFLISSNAWLLKTT